MNQKRKYNTAEIIAAVLCGIGCLLLVLPKLIETEMDLFTLALAFNGIGIAIFLFGRKQGES